MKVTRYTLTALCLLCIPSLMGCTDYPERDRIKEIVEKRANQPADEYMLFHAPSYPPKIERVIPEWEPVESLVLALPYQDAIENAALLDYFEEIIRTAIRFTDVVLLLDERELISFRELLTRLEAAGLNRYLLQGVQGRRIHILPARFNTMWIRDYGPFFVTDKRSRVFLTDSDYRDVRRLDGKPVIFDSSALISLNKVFENVEPDVERHRIASMERSEDDSALMYLAYHLNRLHDKEIQIIRVPLQLSGGEIFFDGEGNVFLSTESLFNNGGHRADVEILLRHYYGVRKIAYLDPLPGDAIKHLDMIFKPVDKRTFLVAEYPEAIKEEDVYMKYLHEETRRILDENAAMLRRRFPNHRVVRMPMPALERVSKLPSFALETIINLFETEGYPAPVELEHAPELWTLRRFAYFLYTMKMMEESPEANHSSALSRILEKGDSRRYADKREAFLNQLVSKLIHDDPDLIKWVLESFRANQEQTGAQPGAQVKELDRRLFRYVLDGLEEDPGSYTYVYRTYLNATYLDGPSGRVLLVPSYKGYDEMEKKVRNIYGQVYPDTEIVFINSDEIISKEGAIHCVTTTVPAFARNKYH